MFKNKRKSFGTAKHWIKGHKLTLERYLNKFYPIYDWPIIRHFFWENPIQGRVILDDFQKSNESKIRLIFELFHSEQGILMYVIGAKGSGKTATGFFFAEREHNEFPFKKIFYIGKKFDKDALPSWCSWKEKLQDVPNKSFGIIDEIGIQASARDYQSRNNKDLSQVLFLARQKKIPLIVLTQDSRLGEVNIWRIKDIILWKKSNTYELQSRDSRSQSERFWQKVRHMMAPRKKSECLFEYPAKKRFIHLHHSLPECWNDNLSEIYRDAQFHDSRHVESERLNIDKKRKTISKKIVYPNKIVIG